MSSSSSTHLFHCYWIKRVYHGTWVFTSHRHQEYKFSFKSIFLLPPCISYISLQMYLIFLQTVTLCRGIWIADIFNCTWDDLKAWILVWIINHKVDEVLFSNKNHNMEKSEVNNLFGGLGTLQGATDFLIPFLPQSRSLYALDDRVVLVGIGVLAGSDPLVPLQTTGLLQANLAKPHLQLNHSHLERRQDKKKCDLKVGCGVNEYLQSYT